MPPDGQVSAIIYTETCTYCKCLYIIQFSCIGIANELDDYDDSIVNVNKIPPMLLTQVASSELESNNTILKNQNMYRSSLMLVK